jgi:hypothetical protein
MCKKKGGHEEDFFFFVHGEVRAPDRIWRATVALLGCQSDSLQIFLLFQMFFLEL